VAAQSKAIFAAANDFILPVSRSGAGGAPISLDLELAARIA